LDGSVKSKVLFALALFLHLLVHPLVHAAEMQTFAPYSQASIARAALLSPATPECAVCHVARHAQANRPAANALVAFDPHGLVTASPQFSPSEPIENHLPPRAPPVA
jgi:mono/diheme cytochrome c family protein